MFGGAEGLTCEAAQNYFGATSKVDIGNTFLTYSQFPGVKGDNPQDFECDLYGFNIKI